MTYMIYMTDRSHPATAEWCGAPLLPKLRG